LLDTGRGYAMKLQAHMPSVSIGAREWRAVMIALVSLLGAVILLLALQSDLLLNNPLFERFRTPSMGRPQTGVSRRVSLDLHLLDYPIGALQKFSVAHSPPSNVAWSQRFSIGAGPRVAFEIFGDSALRQLLANERTERQLRPSHDRLLLMLMLLRLHSHSSPHDD
jgi:hypothetical protein